jgi:hypothetical protein
MRPADDEMDRDDGRVVDLLASLTAEDSVRHEVPAGLWDDIAVRLSTADQPTVLADRSSAPSDEGGLRVVPTPTTATSDSTTSDDSASDDTASDHTAADDTGSVTHLDDHRRRQQRWRRVAAAAAVVVVAAGTFGVITANSPDTTTELVASVELQPLKEAGSGTAELVTVDGVQQLRISAAGLPPAPGGHHYEMWLIDADVTDPRSLGSLPSGQEEIVVDVPEGVDPDEYPIVDINLQVDGDEQHSGVDTSVLRGTLA